MGRITLTRNLQKYDLVTLIPFNCSSLLVYLTTLSHQHKALNVRLIVNDELTSMRT